MFIFDWRQFVHVVLKFVLNSPFKEGRCKWSITNVVRGGVVDPVYLSLQK